jgi:hypothetical protein
VSSQLAHAHRRPASPYLPPIDLMGMVFLPLNSPVVFLFTKPYPFKVVTCRVSGYREPIAIRTPGCQGTSSTFIPSSSSLGCGLLDPFSDFPYATNNVRPAQGVAAVAAHRRHDLKVEDEGFRCNFCFC